MGGTVAIAKKIIKPSRPTPAPAPTPVVSPTAPEVSQSEATNMDGYDARKTKAKGRSTTSKTNNTRFSNRTYRN